MLLGCLALAVAAGPQKAVDIDVIPASEERYVGSPSLAILPGGAYVASHDEFGPKGGQATAALTRLFRSDDRGATWRAVGQIRGAFWSTLFVHRGRLYLMGTDREYGDLVIRASTDGGATWTKASVLLGDGNLHTAPVPVVESGGRVWRAFERRDPSSGWAANFRAGMLSAPTRADLLDPAQWRSTNLLPSDRAWNGGDMGGWLEGNAVVGPEGRMLDVLRVDTRSSDEKAAVVRVSSDGRTATFDPSTGFVAFPGGAKKFTIRFDPKSRLYWTLASIVVEPYRGLAPGGVRNTLALTSSPDLSRWTVRRIVASDPDVKGVGFQYVDWCFDGEDLVAACRTALSGAHNAHDTNRLTFHRIAGFRGA